MKPMSPEIEAACQDLRNRTKAHHEWTDGAVLELLADRDLQVARLDTARRQTDELQLTVNRSIDRLAAKLSNYAAALEGMTTEAKRLAADREALMSCLERALALHMFDDRPGVLDRVGALHYLRSHGLPEATPAALDAACEGLETPWGSKPACNSCEWAKRVNSEAGPGPNVAEARCAVHGLTDTEDIAF